MSSSENFYSPFAWLSLLTATLCGFSIAAFMSFTIGHGDNPGSHFVEFITLHGHAQLFGWIGVLLVGISLFVFPRMLGAKVIPLNFQLTIFTLLLIGSLLDFQYLVVIIFNSNLPTYPVLAAIFQLSAILIWSTILISRIKNNRSNRPDIKRIWPWFAAMFFGILSYSVGHVLIAGHPYFLLFGVELRTLLIEIFIRFTLVGAILGFGTKMLPVFMGLRAPLWRVQLNGILYLLSAIILIAGELLSGSGNVIGAYVSAVAHIALGFVVLWYLAALDPFCLLQKTPTSLKVIRPDEKTIRGAYADKGEFGKWEAFVFAGLGWLSFAALIEVYVGISSLLFRDSGIDFGSIRHIYLLGFASNFVVGMSYRLLPGLMRKPLRLKPAVLLVALTLNAAAALRVLPTLGAACGVTLSGYANLAFSFSGPLGLLAILFFTTQLLSGPTREGISGVTAPPPRRMS